MSEKNIKADLHWQTEMHFECYNHDLISHMDATEDHGGHNLGATPKETLLNAMMGCTAMDVLALLKKMRQGVLTFSMKSDAEMTAEHPIHFKSVSLEYDLSGELDPEKVIKAVTLSMTKYCGVNFMISRSCPVYYKVILNDKILLEDQAKFES